MTTTQDFSHLRNLAYLALPAPWEAENTEAPYSCKLDFRKAATPEFVIALLDALEALQAEVAQAKFSYMDGYEGGKQEARDAAHEEIKGLTAERDALQAEVADATALKHLLYIARQERDAALARLAEIEAQEPVAEMTLVDMGIGDARQLRVNWLMDGYLDIGAKLFAAAGASPQPSVGQQMEDGLKAIAKRFGHDYWYAGQEGCPPELKATNGELHTLRCKKCGKDKPDSKWCEGASPQPVQPSQAVKISDAETGKALLAWHEMHGYSEIEKMRAALKCFAAINAKGDV